MGESTCGRTYASAEAMWKVEAGKKSDWYDKSIKHWEAQDASVDGVLQGHTEVHMPDIAASAALIAEIRKLRPEMQTNQALDGGAGVGRVTEGLLSKIFSRVDLVEPVSHLLDKAKAVLKEGNPQYRFFVEPLQEFKPTKELYDCIWLQWCLLYLTDKDLVEFLERCAKALAPGGVVVVKENVVTKDDGFLIDTEDMSIARTDSGMRKVFQLAGLELILQKEQPDYPKNLIPLKMYCLVPKR